MNSNRDGRRRSKVRLAGEKAAYPAKLENRLSARWPNLWGDLDKLSADTQDVRPSYCLRSPKVYETQIKALAENSSWKDDVSAQMNLALVVQVIDTWRQSRMVLDFDEDLARALWRTATPDAPPAVLYQLPWQGIYLPLSASLTNGTALEGFRAAWCCMSYRVRDHCPMLMILLDRGIFDGDGAVDLYIELNSDDWQGPDMMFHPLDMSSPTPATLARERKWAIASLLVYLCSINKEISSEVVVPAGRSKRGKPSASQITVAEVGVRVGSVLRAARHRRESYEKIAGTSEGRTVVPHMRSAHFHTYWTGPMTGPRTPSIKWLPPLPVGVGDRPVVVRAVR